MKRFGGRFWDRILLAAGLLVVAAVVIPQMCAVNRRFREAQVKRNCRVVQYAAEEFARRSGGLYPLDLADRTADGVPFASLLPGGVLLRNPFTRECSEPVLGSAATPGQTGYRPVFRSRSPIGYVITGCGVAPSARVCVLTGQSCAGVGEADRLVSLDPDHH